MSSKREFEQLGQKTDLSHFLNLSSSSSSDVTYLSSQDSVKNKTYQGSVKNKKLKYIQ